MDYSQLLSNNIKQVPRSFIREILKTAISPQVISFAGGLPNGALFPVEAFKKAASNAIDMHGSTMFQYSNTEGYDPLRQWICDRYKRIEGWTITPDQVLITNGSQQGLDLIGKVLINRGDRVIIEEPGYLGAIQSLAVQGAKMVSVPMESDGMDVSVFQYSSEQYAPKLVYSVPAFQNPTGISYSDEKVRAICDVVKELPMMIVEDTPYRDISFTDNQIPSFYKYLPDQTILLGSFSKTTVPGFRLGWMVAPQPLMERLIVAKQAADLHSDVFSQMVLFQYLTDEDHEAHIKRICQVYSHQCSTMIRCMERYFPETAQWVQPAGGMFLWVNFPSHVSSIQLFEKALDNQVAFVPGVPFYIDGRKDASAIRLNFTCSDESTIDRGIHLLGEAIQSIGYE